MQRKSPPCCERDKDPPPHQDWELPGGTDIHLVGLSYSVGRQQAIGHSRGIGGMGEGHEGKE